MLTIRHGLFSSIDDCELIRNIYGEDLATELETIEFNITEARNNMYIAMISEAQRDIILKNMDAIVAIYLRLKVHNKLSIVLDSHYSGLMRSSYLEDKWETRVCSYLFSSIFRIFNDVNDRKYITCNKLLFEEITTIIKSYLKYLGKETEIEDAIGRINKKNIRSNFYSERDFILPLTVDDLTVPADLIIPREVKYEVRREINGIFYATTSEESALELSEYRKEFVSLAYENYYSIINSSSEWHPETVFYERYDIMLPTIYVYNILSRIKTLVFHISLFTQNPKRILYVTKRHLEEIHLIAQDCLEVGMFNIKTISSKIEIKDSVQLAQLIDTNVKTLDPPTGSRTKPAVREVCE